MATLKKRSQKTGLPAGSLVHVGERKTDKTTIKSIIYNQELFKEGHYVLNGFVFQTEKMVLRRLSRTSSNNLRN